MSAVDVVVRNGLVSWRGWRASLFLSVLAPVMFLSAMGLGLGSLVEEGQTFGGVDYLAFFATGMLAANSMQNGVFGATYPMMSKITWQRNYEAMLASPLSVRQIFLGELAWSGIALGQVAVPYFVVMTLFGIFDSPQAILAIPAAILLGLSCAAPMMAYTATQQTDEAFTWIFRLIVTPMFLLGGTFFPIEELPGWAQVVAQATPVFHGVELIRQVTVYDLELSALWHIAYLVILMIVGTTLGIRNLEKRMQP
jgi:lipooligosaccharide transport system permease protein